MKHGRIERGEKGRGSRVLSSWKIGLNCDRREGNGAAYGDERRSSVALVCAESVAFATFEKSWSEVDESENVGDEMDLIFCCSLCYLVSFHDR